MIPHLWYKDMIVKKAKLEGTSRREWLILTAIIDSVVSLARMKQ